MAKKPTMDDARLILQLYELKREPEMRKARQWWLVTFWPNSADDYIKGCESDGHGREQLDETGDQLLGNRFLFCAERFVERETVSPTVVFRRNVFHTRKDAAFPERVERKNE